MTPQARIAAAADILDAILSGQPAEQALLRWSRASRFAGSGDRAAVRDLVFDSLRRRDSRATLGGALTGRGLMLGMCRESGLDPTQLFTGVGHAPAALTPQEIAAGAQPDGAAALDLPEWLMPLWRDALADQADPIALALRDRAGVWLRLNPRKATATQAIAALEQDGVTAATDPRLPSALLVSAGERRIANSRAYREGWVELQDLSPQLACAGLPLRDGQRVLDYCAGGGGKALALAARADLQMVAHDANSARMGDLPARAERAGVQVQVAERPCGMFDLVVADVPCSGSGTWRRTPDQKWRLDRGELATLIQLQDRILRDAAEFVKVDGHLAYMTCSLLRDENEGAIGGFLADSGRFELIEERRFTPLTASDGFFMALLVRRR